MTNKRNYNLGVRAEYARETYESILAAAHQAFSSMPYEKVSLRAIADKAGVSQQTVIRLFDSKDNLLATAASETVDELFVNRKCPQDASEVEPLIRNYLKITEQISAQSIVFFQVSERFESLRPVIKRGRQCQREWIEQVFRFYLPDREDKRHSLFVAQLFSALSFYSWYSLRCESGLSVEDATEATIFTIFSLIQSFQETKPRL